MENTEIKNESVENTETQTDNGFDDSNEFENNNLNNESNANAEMSDAIIKSICAKIDGINNTFKNGFNQLAQEIMDKLNSINANPISETKPETKPETNTINQSKNIFK